MTATVAVEVDEADEGRFVEGNSLPGGDFVQRVVNVRQMVCGDIVDEGARDFVVAHAAMEPTEEEHELHAYGKDRSENAVPVSGHGVLGSAVAGPLFFHSQFAKTREV